MGCPSPELLAATAEDLVDPQERREVLDHAARCDDCRRTLLAFHSEPPAAARPRATVRIRRRPPSPLPWIVAASLAVAAVGLMRFKEAPPGVPPAPSPVALAPERPEPPRIEPPAPSILPAPVAEPVPAPPAPVAVVPPAALEPPPPPAEPSPPPTSIAATTVAAVAEVAGLQGEVFLVSPQGRVLASVGQTIASGAGVECAGPRSAALVTFADRTRVELAGDTVVRSVVERDATRGRRLVVEKGTVKAEVAKQPAGLPMVFETPHGEARVLGTTLALVVDGDPKKGTRLEVEEGRVELKNAAGRTALVEGGHQAVAAAGAPLAAKALPREETILAFSFDDGRKPALASLGVVERGPGGRLCLAAEGDGGGTAAIHVGDGDRGLFTVRGDEVLQFDYWVDPQAGDVNFSIWNRTQARSIEASVPRLVVGKWTHATLRLADVGMREGDWIVNLRLQGTGSAPRRFYVDNLVITRARVLRPGPLDTKK